MAARKKDVLGGAEDARGERYDLVSVLIGILAECLKRGQVLIIEKISEYILSQRKTQQLELKVPRGTTFVPS